MASLKFLIFTTEVTEELVNVVPRTWRGGGNLWVELLLLYVQFEAKATKNALRKQLQHYESFLDLGIILRHIGLSVLARVYNKRGECRTPNITNGKCIRKVT